MADASTVDPAEHARSADDRADADAPWRILAAADSETVAVLQAWTSILRERTGARQAVLALGPANVGPFRVAATAPANAALSPSLVSAVDLSLSDRKPIVKRGEEGDRHCTMAYPILADGKLHGVAALELRIEAGLDLRAVARETEWALPTLLLRLAREGAERTTRGSDRARTALSLLASTLDEPRFPVAASVAATELADALGCDRVSIGFRRRKRTRIAALSHSGGFSRRNALVLRIADGMDEAIDQTSAIVLPADAGNPLTVTTAHERLASHGQERAIATVPIRRAGAIIGAITAERPLSAPFEADALELLDATGGVLGAILEEKRLNDRPLVLKAADSLGAGLAATLGPRRAGLKLGLLAAAAGIAALALIPSTLRVNAGARIEGEVRRVVAAPLDGYIRSAAARASDIVTAGQVMAEMEDREIALELLRWQTLRAQRQREYETALSNRDRAQLGIIRTQIDQADAEIALVQERLARTRLTAPFDGIVLAGDLDQSVGAPVERGQVLFEIAPLESYRVILSVDERDLAVVSGGETGELVLTALPGASYPIETGRVTSVSSVEDGRNVFRVEAKIVGDSTELRPGMRGIAKIDAGERPTIEVWTRGVVDWLRLTFWRWLP